jgi:hypothetical protein
VVDYSPLGLRDCVEQIAKRPGMFVLGSSLSLFWFFEGIFTREFYIMRSKNVPPGGTLYHTLGKKYGLCDENGDLDSRCVLTHISEYGDQLAMQKDICASALDLLVEYENAAKHHKL